MIDENTGKEIACPFCEKTVRCKHLLAEIDRTFLGCSGGYASKHYHKFGELVEAAFKPLLARGAKPAWNNEELQELWSYAVECYSPGEVSLDGDVLTRLIIKLLEGSGDVSYSGTSGDGMGPGFSSALKAIYADKPESACKDALQYLQELLAPPRRKEKKRGSQS